MRVLIIEDEHKIAQALKKALTQDNYAVDISYDGDDGYAMITTEPYDVAIIDWMIPGEYDGIGIVRAIRQEKNHTPVLLLTAKGAIPARVAGLNAGADDYLVKPFSLQELLARVRALLRRPIEVKPTVLTVGDLSLNPYTFEVIRGGKNIELTSKEFTLLEFLMRNQGRPNNKDQIIAHVWDYDADILPNTVEVYIKYLRQKVDDPFKKPLLHTIRGFGYKVESR